MPFQFLSRPSVRDRGIARRYRGIKVKLSGIIVKLRGITVRFRGRVGDLDGALHVKGEVSGAVSVRNRGPFL